jgi:hypothetical protein
MAKSDSFLLVPVVVIETPSKFLRLPVPLRCSGGSLVLSQLVQSGVAHWNAVQSVAKGIVMIRGVTYASGPTNVNVFNMSFLGQIELIDMS